MKMTIYLGYYRPTDGYLAEGMARARKGESMIDPRHMQLTTELPATLPAGCRLVGSYIPVGGDPTGLPGVMIVDAPDATALTAISNHLAGFLVFQWVPAISIGANEEERKQWQASVPAPAPAR